MKRMKRTVVVAALAMSLLAGVALAATPGTYEGWLYKKNGSRLKGTFSILSVNDAGDRFRLSVYNMPLTCPYLDRNGNQAKARFRFIHRGIVQGDFIDDTREYPKDSPTQIVRITGRFTGSRFSGNVRVSSAPQVAGACTGSARIRVSR